MSQSDRDPDPQQRVNSPDFAERFRRVARRVWGRQVLQAAISGASVGAAAALLTGAVSFGLGWPEPRFAILGWLVAGASLGAGYGFKRRWNPEQVALFLDRRLQTKELMVTALGARHKNSEIARWLTAQAALALETVPRRALRWRFVTRLHALALPAFGVAAWLAFQPPARAAAPLPGSARLQAQKVPGLERIEALERAPSLSQSDAERLRQLAEQAKKLRRELARGVEEREAQAELARLREELDGQRQRFSDRAERAGLEAALSELGAEPITRKAEKALGDGDIIAFDEEMQRLATQAEARARDSARQALERAKQRAHEQQAKQLSDLLERQQGAFAQREKESQTLREFAKLLEGALSEEGQRALADLDRTGDPAAQRRLAEALGKALSSLTEEQRQQLAEALKQRLSSSNPRAAEQLSREEIERMLKQLDSPEGREALARGLRELAEESNLDAERERALGDAERGRAEAERGLSKTPLPIPGPGGAKSGPGQPPQGDGPAPKGPPAGQQGSGPGAAGPHPEKQPEPVKSEEFRARAQTRWLPGQSLAGKSFGRAPGRAGEIANEVGTGNLSSHASGELSAVEGADIPEEYREQVGRYFEP